jgi:transaldolase/glucose-6-phosphate isomerase
MFREIVSGLEFSILDSTDPAQVLKAARDNPVATTLFLVSSKSGGTAEVNAMFDYFWKRTLRTQGNKAGEHFIAITDPGTSLEKMAIEQNFRKIFLAEPNVGGRYSALSAFGLVPAALMGLDLDQLLSCASWMESKCSASQPFGRNPGFVLGTILGEAAIQGRDKLTIIADPELSPFGAWLEQLVAESSGKQGKGIVPINGEAPAKPQLYGYDRLFIYLRRNGKYDRKVKLLQIAGQPVLTQDFQDNYAIGGEFYKWEVAIATACSILGVNAFDQPDVQDSKNRTIAKISYYKIHHEFNEVKPTLQKQGISLYGKIYSEGKPVIMQIRKFLEQGRQNDYVAINAFIMRGKKNISSLQKLRLLIREITKLATTIGFGPRFLHSTGQLHKGGRNNGLFLVITADPKHDAEIPGEGLSFGALEHGQALGDLEALEARGRRLMHIHLSDPDLLTGLVDKLAKEYG